MANCIKIEFENFDFILFCGVYKLYVMYIFVFGFMCDDYDLLGVWGVMNN